MIMPPIYFQSLPLEEKRQFVDSFDTILTDCDGVLWNPGAIVPGAVETINHFLNCGKRVFFITNNSTKTKAGFYEKCRKYGFNVPANNLFNTSTLAAKYLKRVLPAGKLVYVVGSSALSQELNDENIENFGAGKEEMHDNILENINNLSIEIRDNVGAVVVGFDQYINYIKMLKAATYLKKKECLFVCTNTDEIFPTSTGYQMPGTGCVVAGIKTACGREPFVIGKPKTFISNVLQEENQINPKRTLFIGDRCNTDILMGNRSKFRTLLVLTGVHSLEDVQAYESSSLEEDKLSVPDYYTDSVGDLCFK